MRRGAERRYFATTIDLIVCIASVQMLAKLDPRYAEPGSEIMWPLGLFAIYEPFLTSFAVTVGQLAMRLRVRDVAAFEKLPLPIAFLRFVIKYFLGIFSIFYIMRQPQRRALHDLASESIVIDSRDPALRAAA